VRAEEKLTAFLELEEITRDDNHRKQTVQKRMGSVREPRCSTCVPESTGCD
jgi:hypothetical protein